MSLEKSSIVWSAKQIRGMVANGKINFDHIVQRGLAWERSRKTGLIESMILGYPVPMIYAKRILGDPTKRGDNTYFILDGKQRLTTVAEFLNDGFALTEIPEVTYYDNETDSECNADISNCKFSELPEALKDNLQTITFNITYFDNLTDEEEKELFKRLNAGKPLTAKNRLIASCKDIKSVLDIGNHELFNEMLTEKAKENKNQVSIIMKCWTMLNNDISEISFESKIFNPIVENTEISDESKLELSNIFTYVRDIHELLSGNNEKKIAKIVYTETHFVSLMPYFKMMLESGTDENMACNWLIDFYSDICEEYSESCQSGIAKPMNIMGRDNALRESYNEFFKIG